MTLVRFSRATSLLPSARQTKDGIGAATSKLEVYKFSIVRRVGCPRMLLHVTRIDQLLCGDNFSCENILMGVPDVVSMLRELVRDHVHAPRSVENQDESGTFPQCGH